MKWNVGTKIATGFGLALAVFVVVGVVSHRGTTQLIEALELRRHTDATLDELTESRLALRGIGVTLRTYLISGEESHFEALKASQRTIDEPLQELRAQVGDTPIQLQRIDRVTALFREYISSTNTIAEVRRIKGLAPAAQLLLADNTRGLLGEVSQLLNELQKEQAALLKAHTAQVERETHVAQWTIVIGTAVALLLAMAAGWLITRNISGPLQELTKTAERVTAGDLNASVSLDARSDEIGVLARALERMTQSLQTMARTAELIAAGDLRSTVQPQSAADVLGNAFARMSGDLRSQISELIEGATVLSSAASEIVASSSQLAASASQSAVAVSETSTTVEEVRQTAQMASQKAKQVSDSAQKAAQISLSGRKSAEEAMMGMNRIRRQMEGIAASMGRLSEQSQAVGQIISTVEDLATQSNLLAVNAAIEAAKAGEHGRGFGVVAQEVKSLAEQSRQATNQVRAILGDIQKATAAAVMATEEGSKAVEAGTSQTEAAGTAIQSLSASVSDATQAATQIAASSQQQLVGVDQVAGAMESIKQASAQNVASSAQLETAARKLGDLGQRIKTMVGRYQV